MNNGNLTIVVTSAVLLTEPRVPPGISVLIRFLWSNEFFFSRMQCLIFKIICLLVRPRLIFCVPAMTLGSHEHTVRFIDGETEAQSVPALPRVMKRMTHVYLSSSLCHPVSL